MVKSLAYIHILERKNIPVWQQNLIHLAVLRFSDFAGATQGLAVTEFKVWGLGSRV